MSCSSNSTAQGAKCVWAAVLSVYLAEHLPSAYVWCGEVKGDALLSEREWAEKTNDRLQSRLLLRGIPSWCAHAHAFPDWILLRVKTGCAVL